MWYVDVTGVVRDVRCEFERFTGLLISFLLIGSLHQTLKMIFNFPMKYKTGRKTLQNNFRNCVRKDLHMRTVVAKKVHQSVAIFGPLLVVTKKNQCLLLVSFIPISCWKSSNIFPVYHHRKFACTKNSFFSNLCFFLSGISSWFEWLRTSI